MFANDSTEATSQPKDVVASDLIEKILLCIIVYYSTLYTTIYYCYLKGKLSEVNCAELLLINVLCAISLELPAEVEVLQI